MKFQESDGIVFLVVIAGRKRKDDLLSSLLDLDARIVNSMYGRGTVTANYLINVLGLVPEDNKSVITCLVTKATADIALRMLIDRYRFNEPNTGVAFTIPINGLSF